MVKNHREYKFMYFLYIFIYFRNRLALVKLNNKSGFIDENHNQIIPCVYDCATDFCNDLSMVNLNNKYGYINTTGVIICEIKYDYICIIDDYFIVKLSYKYGVVDFKSGNNIISCDYTLKNAIILLDKYKLNQNRIKKLKYLNF